MKIEGNGKAFEIDVKRFYLPLKVTTKCPHCGREVTRNFEDYYLSYPTVNVPMDINFMHETDDGNDEHEWSVRAILRVTLEPVEE